MPVSFEAVAALSGRAPDGVHGYGSAPSQRVYFWRPVDPATAPAPVVVLLHGGCWRSEFGVEHVYPAAAALARSGLAVWAPEYRRVGEEGGGWTGTFDDVASAVELLRERAEPGWDLARVALVGHSAGGQLALWAAARSAFAPEHPLYGQAALSARVAIGLAAVTDLEAYAADEGSCQSAVPLLMGGAPSDVGDRYRLVSPSALSLPLPVVLLHGSDDPVVPVSQARALTGAEIRVIEGAGHFDLIHPETPAFDALLSELARWLDDA